MEAGSQGKYLSVRTDFPAEKSHYEQCFNTITYFQIAFYSHIVPVYNNYNIPTCLESYCSYIQATSLQTISTNMQKFCSFNSNDKPLCLKPETGWDSRSVQATNTCQIQMLMLAYHSFNLNADRFTYWYHHYCTFKCKWSLQLWSNLSSCKECPETSRSLYVFSVSPFRLPLTWNSHSKIKYHQILGGDHFFKVFQMICCHHFTSHSI